MNLGKFIDEQWKVEVLAGIVGTSFFGTLKRFVTDAQTLESAVVGLALYIMIRVGLEGLTLMLD